MKNLNCGSIDNCFYFYYIYIRYEIGLIEYNVFKLMINVLKMDKKKYCLLFLVVS